MFQNYFVEFETIFYICIELMWIRMREILWDYVIIYINILIYFILK